MRLPNVDIPNEAANLIPGDTFVYVGPAGKGYFTARVKSVGTKWVHLTTGNVQLRIAFDAVWPLYASDDSGRHHRLWRSVGERDAWAAHNDLTVAVQRVFRKEGFVLPNGIDEATVLSAMRTLGLEDRFNAERSKQK